jgi:hypothetical protein
MNHFSLPKEWERARDWGSIQSNASSGNITEQFKSNPAQETHAFRYGCPWRARGLEVLDTNLAGPQCVFSSFKII